MMAQECDEKCRKLGYCHYYSSDPDYCGSPYKYFRDGRPKKKWSHEK